MRILFNDGWSSRAKATAFQELSGSSAAGWDSVELPHDAIIGSVRSADAPRGETTGYFSGGAFEYRRNLHASAEDAGKLIVLEFDGVYRNANVYVNGALAGQDAFGYSRFIVRIDPFLNFGADNEIRVDCRTHVDSRWYTGAGIYRDVHLIVKDPVRVAVDGVVVRTVDLDADFAVVDVAAEIENSASVTSTARVTVVLVAPDGSEAARGSAPITLVPHSAGTVRHRFTVSRPRAWSVDDPNLYTARIEVATDEVVVDDESVTFGIRTLQLDPIRGLRINGQSVKLRGACIHHDNGPIGAAAFGDAEERKVRLLKEAGFNAIRSAHNPASSALLDACDRLGMLVMDETFDMWTSAKTAFDYSFDFAQWWERDLEAIVAKDINHPSVIFYSIGNEIPETGDKFGGIWSRRLADKIRALDPTRLVTNGINGFVAVMDMVIEGNRERAATIGDAPADQAGGVNQMMGDIGDMMGQIQASPMVTSRTEESYAQLDVAGMNYGMARYELDRALFPDRIIVGTETWPRDIAKLWTLVIDNAHVLGDFTWTGFDYLGEAGIGVLRYVESGVSQKASFVSGYPGLTAYSGDIDIIGHRRTISYYREVVFGLRTEPYIAVQRPERHGQEIAIATPWTWSDSIASWTWSGFEDRPIAIEVYSAAEEIELLLNGVSLGRETVGGSFPFRADFGLTYEPGVLTAVAYVDGVETGRSALESAAADVRLALRAESSEVAEGGLAYIEVVFEDSRGVLQNGADRLVRLEIDGPAVLQGFASGNPTTAESFVDLEHTTFDGRAIAVLRATGAGEVTLTATADDITPTKVAFLVSGND